MSSNYEQRKKEITERFTALRKQAQEDVKFDKAHMENQYDSTLKVAKWLDKRAHWNDLCRSYELKRLEGWKRAFEYYKSDYPFAVDNQEQYKNLIQSDPAYAEILDLALLVSDVVSFIDATIENLKQRQWEMKYFAEWLKFQQGA